MGACTSTQHEVNNHQLLANHVKARRKEVPRRRSSNLRDPVATLMKDAHTFLKTNDTFTVRRQLGNYFTIASSRKCIEFAYGSKNRKLPCQAIIGENDFEYNALIATGGFGMVLKATRKATGKPYALKIQPMEAMARSTRPVRRKNQRRKRRKTARDVLLLHMELTALAICRSHPFIVDLEYALHTDRFAILAMEFVEGGTLSNLITRSRNRCLPFELAKTYVIEMALALHFMHTKGIIYRDLKPSNVLLTSSGHLKLTDFGLAGSMLKKEIKRKRRRRTGNGLAKHQVESQLRNMSTKASSSTMSTLDDPSGATTECFSEAEDDDDDDDDDDDPEVSNQEEKRRLINGGDKDADKADLRWIRRRTVCGTAGYRPPEQVQERYVDYSSRNGYDERADWFSLGVTTYTMIVGRRPFPCRKDYMARQKMKTSKGFKGKRDEGNDDEDGTKKLNEDAEFCCLMEQVDYPENRFRNVPEARGFIEGLLARNPIDRPKYEELKCHAWVKNEIFEETAVMARNIPEWVVEHAKKQSLFTKSQKQGKIKSCRHRPQASIDGFVKDLCADAVRCRSAKAAEDFKNKWTGVPSVETAAMFRHWCYISDDALKLEKTLS